MALLPIKSPPELIEDIRSKLSEKPRKNDAAYTLIVGAGFSYGVVPLTDKMMHQCIGEYYYYDNVYGGDEQAEQLCRDYWEEFNDAGVKSGLPIVKLDDGLPADPKAAYQLLFTYRTANALFRSAGAPQRKTFIRNLQESRARAQPPPPPKMLAGEKFVRKFLQKMLDFGGCLSDEGGKAEYPTEPGKSNDAHRFLAALLKLQETDQLSGLRPFCRTIFTTNFDTLLQNALQSVKLPFRMTDRPEHGLKSADFPETDPAMHLVYTHGSVLRHNAANTTAELAALIEKNAEIISPYLRSKDVLVFGYGGGWVDSLMAALNMCEKMRHRIYWCDIFPAEDAQAKLAPAARDLILSYEGRAFYVPLGAGGADDFMRQLYRAVAPAPHESAISS